MATVDGIDAIAQMRAFRTNQVGWCLGTVWDAYAVSKVGQVGGSYATAQDAFNATRLRHPDRTPPAGVPVWLGPSPTRTDANAAAGDVAISIGGGLLVATDYPYGGVIGTCSIDQREQQTQRPYLGWSEDICGYQVIYPKPATPAAQIKESEDMAFTMRRPNGDVFTLAVEYCRHEASKSTVQYATNVLTAEDKIIDATQTQFWTLLDSLGIPRSVPDQCLRGKAWSRQNEILVALGKLDTPFQLTNAA